MSTTTKTFIYDFTDSVGYRYDFTIVATNSELNFRIYNIIEINGFVSLPGGVEQYPITGVNSFFGATNTLSNSDGYDSVSFFDYAGVSFSIVEGSEIRYFNLYGGATVTRIAFGDSQSYPEAFPTGSYAEITRSSAFTNSIVEVSCFLPGTLISTPTGSTPVQNLQIGDLILNNVGQSVPVKWIGSQRLHPAFARDHLPICIRAGALGHDLPLRDLFVSPCHAFYIDNCLLVQAKALVNGTSITQVTQWEGDLQYLHIETEHHEIILAEGAPTETFMDNISRACFNNYSEYQTLYPEAHEMIELDIPRVCHQRQLPNAVKARLEAISVGLLGNIKVQMIA